MYYFHCSKTVWTKHHSVYGGERYLCTQEIFPTPHTIFNDTYNIQAHITFLSHMKGIADGLGFV